MNFVTAGRDRRLSESTSSSSTWDHPETLLQGLRKLQEQNLLCDVTINIGGRTFTAHKAILAACGDYFLAMFTSNFKEKSDHEISISGTAAAFQVLLDFAYTGELKRAITTNNMYDVVELACYTQFTNFGKACCDTIVILFDDDSKKVAVSDAYKICLLARNHNYMKDLLEAALEFLDDHVDGLKNLDTFLQNTSYAFLEEFLCREYLGSESEEKQILEMVLNWLRHDWDNRRIHAHSLLQKVRLGLVSTDDIRDLIGPDILNMEGCSELVERVLQMQTSEKSSESLALDDPSMFTTRSTITAPITSVRRDSRKQFEFFNQKRGSWMDLDKFAPLPSNASHFSTIVAEGKLYAAGGAVRNAAQQKVYLKDFYCYNSSENKWVTLQSMTKARRNFHMVYLDGFIYAIGDCHRSSEALKHVERYSVAENKWGTVASLPYGCQLMSAIAFEGAILVCGALHSNSSEHKLMIYHKGRNDWQCEEFGSYFRVTPNHKVLMLFVYNQKCYRILYNFVEKADGFSGVPTVHAIDVDPLDEYLLINIGEKVSQDQIERDEGAFRIGDEVFLIQKGFVQKTDVKVEAGKYVHLYEWGSFNYTPCKDRTNVTLFTFDRKKLSNDEAYEEY